VRQIGRELGVRYVLEGSVRRIGDTLRVNVQLVSAETGAHLWSDRFDEAIDQLAAGQQQIIARMQDTIGASVVHIEAARSQRERPANPDALDLVLRARSLDHLPPTPAKDEEIAALYERALALDPSLIFAAGQLITNRVERGDLTKAYQEAHALLKRRPESAQAHFTMGYVDRYAGLLEDSTRECDTALRLDPGNYLFRSCALTFLCLGNIERAREYVQLDAGSEWANWAMLAVLLREGKMNEAREAAKAKKVPMMARYSNDLMEAALGLLPVSELNRMAQEAMKLTAEGRADPEPLYEQGTILAFAGKKKAALHLIRIAVEQNYCALSALEHDPLLSKVRRTREFADLLKAARSCQQPVLAQASQAN